VNRALFGIVALAFVQTLPSTVPASAQGAAVTGDWREQYAYAIGVQAYVYGFPYVYMSEVRWGQVAESLLVGHLVRREAQLG